MTYAKIYALSTPGKTLKSLSMKTHKPVITMCPDFALTSQLDARYVTPCLVTRLRETMSEDGITHWSSLHFYLGCEHEIISPLHEKKFSVISTLCNDPNEFYHPNVHMVNIAISAHVSHHQILPQPISHSHAQTHTCLCPPMPPPLQQISKNHSKSLDIIS